VFAAGRRKIPLAPTLRSPRRRRPEPRTAHVVRALVIDRCPRAPGPLPLPATSSWPADLDSTGARLGDGSHDALGVPQARRAASPRLCVGPGAWLVHGHASAILRRTLRGGQLNGDRGPHDHARRVRDRAPRRSPRRSDVPLGPGGPRARCARSRLRRGVLQLSFGS